MKCGLFIDVIKSLRSLTSNYTKRLAGVELFNCYFTVNNSRQSRYKYGPSSIVYVSVVTYQDTGSVAANITNK